MTSPLPAEPTRIGPDAPEGRKKHRGNRHFHRLRTSNSKFLRVSVAAILATVTIGGVSALELRKDVTVSIDGEDVELTTFKSDVRSALDEAGYKVGENDVIIPGLDASLASGDTVSVDRSRPVSLVADSGVIDAQTTAKTVGEFLSENGIDPSALRGGNADDKLPLDGSRIEVAVPRVVTIADGNDELHREYVFGNTVREAFERSGTPLGEDDIVLPAADAPILPGMFIRVLRVTHEEEKNLAPIDPPREEIDAPELDEGTEEVVTPGTPGEREEVWTVTKVNGNETERQMTSENTLTEPVATKVRVGSKKAAPATPAVAAGGTVWDELVQCEATGNWNINSGNGFSGGLQFTPSTWQAYGGGQYAPEAWQATREQQIAVAEKVQAAQGWGAWPACTSKMGLR